MSESPGFDAITNAFERVYGKQAPHHWGTLISYRLGGPDPLDGISAYRSQRGDRHWHLVTFGFSDLYEEKEGEDPDLSGYGFELTLRVARGDEDEPPVEWAAFLQTIARYVFQTGNLFKAGDHIDFRRPIVSIDACGLTGLLVGVDPEIEAIQTVHGNVTFLQLIGLRPDELDVARWWNGEKLWALLGESLPMWITRPARASVLDDAAVRARLDERVEQDGSSVRVSFMPGLVWKLSSKRLTVSLPDGGGHVFVNMLRGRTLHARDFVLQGDTQEVRFNPSEIDSVNVEDASVSVELTEDSARKLISTLRDDRQTCDVGNLRIKVK